MTSRIPLRSRARPAARLAGAVLPILATVLPDLSLSAQCELCVLPGAAADDRFGWALAGRGDRFYVAAPAGTAPFQPIDSGTVNVYQWAAGAHRTHPAFPFPLAGGDTGHEYGYSIALGPADELIVGSPRADTTVGTHSGRSALHDPQGLVFRTVLGTGAGHESGTTVAHLGDIDGDGFADFAMRSHLDSRGNCGTVGSSVVVYSSNPTVTNNGHLGTVYGTGQGDFFCNIQRHDQIGIAISRLGDVDGVAGDEFLVSNVRAGQISDHARVYTWDRSLATPALTLLRRDTAPDVIRSLAAMGDVNGDQVPDYARGTDGRRVQVIDGASGAVLWTRTGTDPSFGSAIANCGDQDADGVDDLLVGAPAAQNDDGRAFVLSGAAGKAHLLYTIHSNSPGGRFGAAVAGIGDLTGDGRPELLIGAPDASPGALMHAGQATVYSLDDALPQYVRYGTGCAPAGTSGLEPTIGTPNGAPRVGHAGFSLGISGTVVGHPVILTVNFAPAMIAVPIPQLTACTLLVHPIGARSFFLTGTSWTSSPDVGQGAAQVVVPIPPVSSLVGLRLVCQGYASDPGGVLLPGTITRGLDLRVRP